VKNILTKTRNREVLERNLLKTYNIMKNPAGSKRMPTKSWFGIRKISDSGAKTIPNWEAPR